MPPHLLPPVCHNLPSLSHAPCRRIPPTRGSPHDSPPRPPTSVPGGLKSSLGVASQFAETHRTFLTLIAAGAISTFYLGGTFSGHQSDLKHETEQRQLDVKLHHALNISKAREEVARAETAMLRVFFGHEHHAAVEKAQEKAQKDLEKAEKSQEAEKGQEGRSLWASLWASWGGWGGERSSTAAEPSLRLEA